MVVTTTAMKSVTLFVSFISLCVGTEPPETWQENWYEHNQILARHYHDDDVAVYFDKEMDRSLTWMNTYLHDAWSYVKKSYGNFGDDPHLYAIFHKGKYIGGHPTSYFEKLKSYRNVIDLGKEADRAWTLGDADQIDHISYYIGRLVLNCNHGVHQIENHPQFSVSVNQWVEIFQYDLYLGINRQEDADRIHDKQIRSSSVSWPRENTNWFRDWYYPIYEQYGGPKVLNRFFELLAEYFPKSNLATFNRPQYLRFMNTGEFVHFWSGAARVNLKAKAREAFGWNSTYEAEWQQARTDYPAIKYFNIIVF